jgi:hypothetical protein
MPRRKKISFIEFNYDGCFYAYQHVKDPEKHQIPLTAALSL